MVKIEAVDVRKIISDGNLKAFADVKFGEEILVKGFNVVQGKRGLFVTMPRKAGKDGRWFDILVALNAAVKERIDTAVLVAYDKETE